MAIIKWAYWFFWTSRRCDHAEGKWRMIEAGMRKARYCVKCGKCTDII